MKNFHDATRTADIKFNIKKLPLSENIYRIILSSPTKNAEHKRVEIIKNGDMYQASMFTEKQVFHKNIQNVESFISDLLGSKFMQYVAWDGKREYSARVTKKGKLLTTSKNSIRQPNCLQGGSFNKQKNHVLNEGDPIPVLVDMGIFTSEYKVKMYDKFQQINRFLELIADETKNLAPGTTVNVIDFGCGKSYLTFLTYYFFFEKQKAAINICGMDLNESVIKTCTEAAKKYGYHSLNFKLGDIGHEAAPPIASWGQPETFNIVISLHACDTATDFALFNAVRWKADLIFAVPCCQHELRSQMEPQNLSILSDYGIIKERFASLATDAIRAKTLEHMGYKAQIIEFAPFEHTAKNLLIRARLGNKNPNALPLVEKFAKEFAFKPKLLELFELTQLQNISKNLPKK